MQNSLRMKTHPSQLSLKPVTTEMLLELFPFGKLLIIFSINAWDSNVYKLVIKSFLNTIKNITFN